VRVNLAGKAIVASALTLAFVGALAVSARADETVIPSDVLASLNAGFDELSVAPEVREGLLEAYAKGKAWDNSSGSEPVTTKNYRVGITEFTRKVYADGSVSLTSVEVPLQATTGRIGKRSAPGGCTYGLNAGIATWSNCKVEKNNGVLTMWYRAGYWRGPGVYGTSITNTWDWDIQAAGVACSKDYLGNPTSQKSRLRAYCTLLAGIGSAYPYLDLDVTATTASVNANW